MKKVLTLILSMFLLSGCLLDTPDNVEDYHITERISVNIDAGDAGSGENAFQFYVQRGDEPLDDLDVAVEVIYRGESLTQEAEYVSPGLYQVPLTGLEDGLYEVRMSVEVDGQLITPAKYIGIGQLTAEEEALLEGNAAQSSGGHHH
ncbi:hypothetical protein [Jeotgalibacillus terrae]|uniref:YtkA-like domain-containing protein n=1 Tax=Jeotgalibacillus terrae TaxID=587735 RepID=A0ABW5ZK00_9BACL|nr:hypothetical protein [Jeotgalibacillus terrae]MBM7578663.1 hypothetical protein [Jeotgalibacillus terrae]